VPPRVGVLFVSKSVSQTDNRGAGLLRGAGGRAGGCVYRMHHMNVWYMGRHTGIRICAYTPATNNYYYAVRTYREASGWRTA
jgi:hypothetical protein